MIMWNRYGFPVVLSTLLVYFLVEEYRRQGLWGVLLILAGGLVIFLAVFIGIELLARKGRRAKTPSN